MDWCDEAIKNFSSQTILLNPFTSILTDRKNFKQKLVQCPIIFPPIITILWGRNNEGKNINEIKVIPEKKKIENITFLIILIEF